MNRLLPASALLALATALAAPLAAAQTSVAVQADLAAQAPVDTAATPAVDPMHRPYCLQHTGSRIAAVRNQRARSGNEECIARHGRAYTREDLDRTGEVDLAAALRKLDTSIR